MLSDDEEEEDRDLIEAKIILQGVNMSGWQNYKFIKLLQFLFIFNSN